MRTKKNQRQISIQEYIETYCQEKRIRERFAVYISAKTHEKLKKIARLFNCEHHTTTSSLADSIISHHIEVHRELLNDAHREDIRKLFDRINGGDPEKKEPESSQDNDSGE